MNIGILAKTIFALFHIVANFIDFHPRNHTYLIGIFCFVFIQRIWPNTISSQRLKRWKSYKAMLILPKPRFSSFFAISSVFTPAKPLYARHTYQVKTYCFVSSENTAQYFSEHEWRRSKRYKALFMLPSLPLTPNKSSLIRYKYLIGTFWIVMMHSIQSNTFSTPD